MRAGLVVILWGIVVVQAASRARGAELPPAVAGHLAPLVGQPADIAPSAYLFRSVRKPGENPPETEFLFAGAIKHEKAGVICGLLWEEPRPIQRVELSWPTRAKAVPPPEDLVVRWLPHGNSSSWWSRRAAGPGKISIVTAETPQVSGDGRRYVYTVDALKPDTAADNLVVALKDGARPPAEPYAVPTVRVITPETWKLVDVEIEWGFQGATQRLAFDGRIEAYNGVIGTPEPLAGDAGTTMVSDYAWRSKQAGNSRRGIRVRLLYLGTTQNTSVWRQQARLENANRTIVTVRTTSGSFSFLPADLETGPILAPEYGFFVRATDRRQAASATVAARVRGWGSNATPWFGVNAADQPVKVSTFTLPSRSVAMHPGPTRPVAAGWRSPIRGRVSIRAKVASGDSKGGNAIQWWIRRDSKAGSEVLASGAIERGGAQSIPVGADAPKLTDLAVDRSDLVSLVVGPKGDHAYDTTVVELAITDPREKARAWDLTNDVVDSIHAGNPHADSLGNPAVWHFYAPEGGVVPDPVPVVEPSRATTAREFETELAARNLKTVRQRVREHQEQTWEGAMQAMHPGGNWPPYPKPEFQPAAQIEVPDRRLTDAWRCGAWHLLRVLKKDQRGRYVLRDYPYDALAHETYLIIRALDLQGMHRAARDGLARWLERDEKKPARLDGLFPDTLGAMTGVEWDWQHAGGPGVIQWQMVEHYLLTGDKDWLTQAAPKLQANADWMIRQRRVYLNDVPGRERLWTHGLQPPHNIWDSTNWRPWYESNANYWFGLNRYAEVIADLDAELSRKYTAEARAYAKDVLAAVEKSFVLSPVVRVRDGTYRSFLPPAPYIRGPASRFMPTSFGSPEHTPGLYPDAIRGGVHLINLSGLLPATDPRAQGLLDVLEDRLLLEHHRLPMRTAGYDPAKHWFSHAGWYYQCGIERTANVHLQWDDVPNFLRSFYNQYAVDIVVGPYTFNEHTTRGPSDKSFEEAAFLERLRNMLVMEEGASLWLARATPRAWLAQGKRIAAKNMPTHFGTTEYEIVSDVDNGKITAAVELPSRKPAKAVLLRLRRPQATPIRSVTVNGKPWSEFNKDKELIKLEGLTGKVIVVADYLPNR